MTIKVAAVSFINSAPLWWGMKDDKGVELRFMPSKETATRLLDGAADLAIVPTYELIMNGLIAAAPVGVLSPGDVRSVLLFHPGASVDLKKIYLDPASRTSQAMTRYLFSDRGIAFATGRKEPGGLRDDEAQLLIGDDALKLYGDPMPKLDIATMWKEKTGTCALFALWAQKEGRQAFDTRGLIESAVERSLEKLDEIIAWAGSKTGLDENLLRHYFEKSLFYRFGEQGEKALNFCGRVFGQQ